MGFFDNAFTPFGREYCTWYYFWMVVFFVITLLTVVSSAITVLTGKAKPLTAFVAVISPGLLYFNFRLLYSMCVQ